MTTIQELRLMLAIELVELALWVAPKGHPHTIRLAGAIVAWLAPIVAGRS